jgi:hypothetical protein
LLGHSSSASAADIDVRRSAIIISGEIVTGDADRFEDALGKAGPDVAIVKLRASPGGDLREAIRIGQLIRRLKMFTDVAAQADPSPVIDLTPEGAYVYGTDADATCASACFFIWIAGAQRQGNYMLVVHRPYFDPTEFSKLGSDQAQSAYAELEKVAYSYLEAMGTPGSVIDLIRRTPSNNGTTLETRFVVEELWPMAPDIDEWLRAKCGAFSPRLIRKAQAWAHRLSIVPFIVLNDEAEATIAIVDTSRDPALSARDLWQETGIIYHYGAEAGNAAAREVSVAKLRCVFDALATERDVAWTSWAKGKGVTPGRAGGFEDPC